MPTTEIASVTIEYVNPPKEGGKYGNIKTKERGTIFALPALLQKIRTNGAVSKIEIKTADKGTNGRPPFAEVTQVWENKDQLPPKEYTKPRMDPADAKGAFISLMCQAWAEAGMIAIDAQAVAKARKAAALGYDIDSSPPRQRRDDMGDEIPESEWQWPKSENPAGGMDDPIPF